MKDLDTIAAVAEYLCYADLSGAWKWLKAKDVRMERRGRRWMVRKAAVDRALAEEATGDTVARAQSFRKASGF